MNLFDIDSLAPGSAVHLVGIGGISMSGLAEILLKKGFAVTGSDSKASALTWRLENLGAKIAIGHDAKNITDQCLVVYTAAVKEDNPELVAAREKKIPTMERALLLGGIMRHFKKSVAVSGTHGKTTTTGLLAAIFLEADADPTISIGGELPAIGGNIRAGQSDVFITEACEYHRSFLNFFPFVSVILNVDADHLDYFKDIDDITDTFYQFAQITPPGGAVVVNCDNENAMRAARGAKCAVITVSAQGRGMLNAENITYNRFGHPSFDVVYENRALCRVNLSVAGSHNVLNALCAFACAQFMGVCPETICAGLKNFKGVKRRFENKGMAGQTLVMDDYAHHPTEIAATIDTLLSLPHNQIYVVFQPHT